jgi:hypothetical protein
MRADDTLSGIPFIVVSARGRREETISASSFTIRRGDGLSIREATHLLNAELETIVSRR